MDPVQKSFLSLTQNRKTTQTTKVHVSEDLVKKSSAYSSSCRKITVARSLSQDPVEKSFFRLFSTCCTRNGCFAVQHSLVTFSGLWSACCSMAVTFQRDGERDFSGKRLIVAAHMILMVE